MLETTTMLWFTAGLAAGACQASMLWRASRRLTAWTPVLGMLRLAVVAMVLVLAALAGAILAAAAGWASGYVPLVACFLARRDDRVAASPVPNRSE